MTMTMSPNIICQSPNEGLMLPVDPSSRLNRDEISVQDLDEELLSVRRRKEAHVKQVQKDGCDKTIDDDYNLRHFQVPVITLGNEGNDDIITVASASWSSSFTLTSPPSLSPSTSSTSSTSLTFLQTQSNDLKKKTTHPRPVAETSDDDEEDGCDAAPTRRHKRRRICLIGHEDDCHIHIYTSSHSSDSQSLLSDCAEGPSRSGSGGKRKALVIDNDHATSDRHVTSGPDALTLLPPLSAFFSPISDTISHSDKQRTLNDSPISTNRNTLTPSPLHLCHGIPIQSPEQSHTIGISITAKEGDECKLLPRRQQPIIDVDDLDVEFDKFMNLSISRSESNTNDGKAQSSRRFRS